MIEIEKKFRASQEEIAHLLQGATHISTKTQVDTYYDTDSYSLSGAWTWLRKRNGAFELKVPTHSPIDGALCETFHEYETEQEIRDVLHIPSSGNSLAEDLAAAGYSVFGEITTTRESYTKDGFTIDIDHATAVNGFLYNIVEIELMVESEDEVASAQERIIAFATAHGLSTSFINGKILEYIVQYNHAQLEVLRANGFRG